MYDDDDDNDDATIKTNHSYKIIKLCLLYYILLRITEKHYNTKNMMYKPTISPTPTEIPHRPVNCFADGNSLMCPTDVMKTALQYDNSKPLTHTIVQMQQSKNSFSMPISQTIMITFNVSAKNK